MRTAKSLQQEQAMSTVSATSKQDADKSVAAAVAAAMGHAGATKTKVLSLFVIL